MSKHTPNIEILEPGPEQLINIYSILGQILDGYWFLETEKRIGFEKALEIDLAVWENFATRETKRILSTLLPDPETRFQASIKQIFSLLEKILKISLFNQSINYEIQRSDNDQALLFKVTDCKTLRGMKNVRRPLDQAQKICKAIGLAYYKNMAKVLHPKLQIDCVTIPSSYEFNQELPLCAWKFHIK